VVIEGNGVVEFCVDSSFLWGLDKGRKSKGRDWGIVC